MRLLQRSRFCRRISAFIIALIFSLSCTLNASAATTSRVLHGNYLGLGEVIDSSLGANFQVRGYHYYYDDLVNAYEIDSLVVWVFNYCSWDINYSNFAVTNHDNQKFIEIHAPISPAVTSGRNSRIEADIADICWAQGFGNSVYTINEPGGYVFTEMSAGYEHGLYGTWTSIWYADRIETTFIG